MLEIGDHAPTNELVNDAGEPAGFVDYRGSKLIVFFYPAAMTPGCTAQACGFRDNFDQFKQAGYDIVGVSPDEPEANAAFREHDALGFRLLSDVDHVVAEQLGAWGMKKKLRAGIRRPHPVDVCARHRRRDHPRLAQCASHGTRRPGRSRVAGRLAAAVREEIATVRCQPGCFVGRAVDESDHDVNGSDRPKATVHDEFRA